MSSERARVAAWTGPLPPNTISENCRGSRPRSLETARNARAIVALATRWMPKAASSTDTPMGSATCLPTASTDSSERIVSSPPTSWVGLMKPSATLASVTVATVPPWS